jgi:hypothetical protein
MLGGLQYSMVWQRLAPHARVICVPLCTARKSAVPPEFPHTAAPRPPEPTRPAPRPRARAQARRSPSAFCSRRRARSVARSTVAFIRSGRPSSTHVARVRISDPTRARGIARFCPLNGFRNSRSSPRIASYSPMAAPHALGSRYDRLELIIWVYSHWPCDGIQLSHY